MPLNLPDDDSAQFFVIGTDAKGLKGAALSAGDTIAVTSADPATVTVSLDAAAGVAPDGTQSVASGTVTSSAAPAAPNTDIALTAQITKADGSAGASASDTVNVKVGSLNALGEVFGAATPIVAQAKR